MKQIIDGHEIDVPEHLMPVETVKVKHTPTPWVARHSNPCSETIIYIDNIYSPSSIGDIATIYCAPAGSENAANAEFIVTACNAHQDLIDALQAARNGIQWFMDEHGADESDHEMLDQIDAALAKAGVSA